MLFPLDIVSQIVKYLPVADAAKTIVSLCPRIETKSLTQIKNEHRDPNIFFEDIVAEVPYFMDLMRMTRAMLVGIRAFSYFHHVNIKSHHPWEFMCPKDILCWLPFIDHLEGRGMEWEPIKQSDRVQGLTLEASSISGWIFSNGKRVKISLTWIDAGRGNIETILDRMGMTPLQCVITGYEAIDPYGQLHCKKMHRIWQEEVGGDLPWLPDCFEAMNICHDAQFKAVTHDVHRQHDPYTRFRRSVRLFREYDSIYINLDTPKFPSKQLYTEISLRLPIATMSWQEGAYDVRAISFRQVMNLPFAQMRQLWPGVSVPRLSGEYIHHNDTLWSINAPSWTTEAGWVTYMSNIFDEEDDSD